MARTHHPRTPRRTGAADRAKGPEGPAPCLRLAAIRSMPQRRRARLALQEFPTPRWCGRGGGAIGTQVGQHSRWSIRGRIFEVEVLTLGIAVLKKHLLERAEIDVALERGCVQKPDAVASDG